MKGTTADDQTMRDVRNRDEAHLDVIKNNQRAIQPLSPAIDSVPIFPHPFTAETVR